VQRRDHFTDQGRVAQIPDLRTPATGPCTQTGHKLRARLRLDEFRPVATRPGGRCPVGFTYSLYGSLSEGGPTRATSDPRGLGEKLLVG